VDLCFKNYLQNNYGMVEKGLACKNGIIRLGYLDIIVLLYVCKSTSVIVTVLLLFIASCVVTAAAGIDLSAGFYGLKRRVRPGVIVLIKPTEMLRQFFDD